MRSSLVILVLAFTTIGATAVLAAGELIVYPQAALGPIGGQEFEIELRLGNRDLNRTMTVTVHFLEQTSLAAMTGMRVRDAAGTAVLEQGRHSLELTPGGSALVTVTSPDQLQVGIAVLEVAGVSSADLTPAFYYRLRGGTAIQDLIAIQPARAPALTFRSAIGQQPGFEVGLAVVSEAAIAAALLGSPLPQTHLTVSVRMPSGELFSGEAVLGGSQPGQKALFPHQIVTGLPTQFGAAQLEISASDPVFVTLLAVGAPPVFEDVQIGPSPAEIEAAARFQVPPGWTIPAGGEELLVAQYWDCAGGGLRAVSGGLIGSVGTGYQTTIHELGPRLELAGPFAVSAALAAAPGLSGSLVLAGRPATGPDWWQGLIRLDLGISDGGVQIMGWNNSPSPVRDLFLRPSDGLSGRVHLRLEYRDSTWLVFADGQQLGTFPDFGLMPDHRLWFGANTPPGERLSWYGLAVEVPDSQPLAAQVVRPPSGEAVPTRSSSLRAAAGPLGLQIGAAAVPELIAREADYRDTLGGEFNMLVAENVMKWGLIQPGHNRFNFCPADILMEFAAANDMEVRGHTLVWHQQNPDWLAQGQFTRAELMEILRRHVQTVVRRYRGRVLQWDVVNEAVNDDGSPRRTLWLDGIGPDYIELAFQWAKEADPSAQLYYNDYGIEEPGRKSDGVFELVRGLRERGVPVDGVGFQCHLAVGQVNTTLFRNRFRSNLQRFADLGVQLALTEVDVRVPLPATPSSLAIQAGIYRDLLGACLEVPACRTLVTWGFTDRYSWIPTFFPGTGAALLFDETYQPKPAYNALLDVLQP